uniref:Uncharacterized protein n=1 Tax=Ascaris lumbricoides TaxID=6252 RepID=A0A0M3I9U1_ASCLU
METRNISYCKRPIQRPNVQYNGHLSTKYWRKKKDCYYYCPQYYHYYLYHYHYLYPFSLHCYHYYYYYYYRHHYHFLSYRYSCIIFPSKYVY